MNPSDIDQLYEILIRLCSATIAGAILEAIISLKSPQILCAARRIIQGMTVQSLTVDNARYARFE